VQYEESLDESDDYEGEKESGRKASQIEESEKELAFYTNIQGQLRMMLDNFFE
jgi:hypothetical protein